MQTTSGDERPAETPAASPEGDLIETLRVAADQTLRVIGSAITLLHTELALARASALALVWLSFALVFLGVGAWLATSAAIAAGVYQLTGNVFYGIGSVALANIVGAILVMFAMRGCWRDLTLPRTRRALHELKESVS